MTTAYVIGRKYMPIRPPVQLGVILWLLLDRLQAVGWVLGIVWTLYGLLFVLCTAVLFIQKHVHPSEIPRP